MNIWGEGYFIPFWIPFSSILRSEGRTKAWRRQNGSIVCAGLYYIIPRKHKNRVPLFFSQKWHMMTITITIGVRPLSPPQFTSHFSNCKANTMTDSYIRSFCMMPQPNMWQKTEIQIPFHTAEHTGNSSPLILDFLAMHKFAQRCYSDRHLSNAFVRRTIKKSVL